MNLGDWRSRDFDLDEQILPLLNERAGAEPSYGRSIHLSAKGLSDRGRRRPSSGTRGARVPGPSRPTRCEGGAHGMEVGNAESGAAEPAAVEPAAVEPAAVEPAAVEPAAVEPAGAEPLSAARGHATAWCKEIL